MSTALAMCSVVALFALAADQYSQISSTDELASKDAVNQLKSMLQKQAAMDKEEAGLFATLTTKQKAAVHKAAAAKKATVTVQAPKARCVLSFLFFQMGFSANRLLLRQDLILGENAIPELAPDALSNRLNRLGWCFSCNHQRLFEILRDISCLLFCLLAFF